MTYEQIRAKEKYLKTLPFYEGYTGKISKVKLRCGKKNCQCYDGKKLHGPYTVFLYRKNGRTHTKYIKKEEVKEFSEKVNANRRYLKIKKEIEKAKKELKKKI